MQATASLPLTRDLVLMGGGHAHALVLRMWAMDPLPGVRLTLIDPQPAAAYSGMLPGFVAGHYSREELDTDLVKLARFAGARLILGRANRIDPVDKTVHVQGRPPIAFDVASIDIGITSTMPQLPGFADHGVPAKPLGVFAARWETFLNGSGPARIACIGGGIAGTELTLAMAHALRARGRLAGATLVDRAEALSAVSPQNAARIRRALSDYGVEVMEQVEITHLSNGKIHLASNQTIESDFTVGAAGTRPYGWLSDCGLEMQDGFVVINDRLQTSDPVIFATGDCAEMAFAPRPKAGVFAVRQAPILLHNLRAALSGQPLKPYAPQTDYLKLVSLGGKRALADRSGFGFASPLLWRWKDRIDQQFISKFRALPAMPAPSLPSPHATGLEEALGTKPLCGGCGSKVGRTALMATIATHPGAARDDLTPLPGDDAALLTVGGVKQVMSTDHLRAMVEDPVVMTEIAAQHALNDIYAMGAAPQAATLSLILPRLSDSLQARTLAEIMATADQVMTGAGAAIVGGHTSLGSELTIGFTLTGLCNAPITLAGARAGDVLLLTKPLGSGTIMAAEMAGKARGMDVAQALQLMRQGQKAAAEILQEAHAMTDVTGFGLIGHLQGLLDVSAVGAALSLSDIPLMQGAEALATSGVRSSIYDANRMLVPELSDLGPRALLFDPQTSGGLLAAVAADKAHSTLRALQDAGYTAAIIGEITETRGEIILH